MWLKQCQLVASDAAQRIVIQDHALDAAILRQHASLRLDLLSGQDAAHRGQERIPVQQLQVPRELLNRVDAGDSFDLHGDRPSKTVAAQQVDRADRGRVLPAYQREALAQRGRTRRQQLLQVRLDAVLGEARIDAQLVGAVLKDLLQDDPQLLPGAVDHPPHAGRLLDPAGWRHPVEWLVGPVIGVDRHRAVGLDHQEPRGQGQMCREPADVVHRAPGDDKPHRTRVARQRGWRCGVILVGVLETLNGWVLAILAVLLLVEFVADKIPIVDHVDDVLQTFVRPTAGGLAFGAASSSQTVTVDNPGSFFASHQWVPIAAGILISLTVHGMKATARPVINATTAGFGAPVVSTIEDVTSVALSFVAIVLPILVLVFIAGLIAIFVWALRWRARRKAAKRAQRLAQEAYYSRFPGRYAGR